MTSIRRALPAVLLAAVAVACGTSRATPPAAPSPTPSPDGQIEHIEASWTDDTVQVTLGNGWVIRGCQGDAPLLCVYDGERLLGDVELGEYPAGEDLTATDDLPAALGAHGRDFLRSMEEDRAVGCPDFAFEPMAVTDATAGGAPAVRTGFVLRDTAGRQVERVVIHVAVHDGAMWVVNASAYTDDGCLSPEQDFEPAELETFEPYLDALVRGTPLPDATMHGSEEGLSDGRHTVRIVERRIDGTLAADRVDLLSGEEAVQAAREDGEIGPDEDLPNDFYIRNLDPATAMVRLAATAEVALIDCTAECRPAPVDRDAFLAGDVTAFNGDLALYEVTVEGGQIVAMGEIYLP